jgi:uncharacterized protein YcbX
MPTVAGFNITPVKSTRLHSPEEIDLYPEGTVGDRRFLFVRDDGSRLSGISKAALMPLFANWDREEERLTITFPDGTSVGGSADPVGDAFDVKLFDRSVPANWVDPVFTVAIRERIDETIGLARVADGEYAGGMHRVSITSRASVEQVGGQLGDPGLDGRRFRMMLELDGTEPFEEDAWRGRRIRAGEAVIGVGDGMPRCVMTTLGPDTGEPDAPVLDALAEFRKVGTELLFGVYGDVLEPGMIRRGDSVELLPD